MAEAINAAGSDNHTVNDIKKKWSDIKVDGKYRTAVLCQIVARTGGEYKSRGTHAV